MSPDAPPLPLPAPELSIYRDYCIALLRRYFRMSVEVGRLPAILGRECFPSRARTYRLHSFEDAVVFVTDIDHCLDRLHPFDKELVARIVLQEYSEEEAARLLHCGLRTIERRLPDALDLLTEMFIRNRMLDVSDAMRTTVTDDNATSQCRDRVPQRAGVGAVGMQVGQGTRGHFGALVRLSPKNEPARFRRRLSSRPPHESLRPWREGRQGCFRMRAR